MDLNLEKYNLSNLQRMVQNPEILVGVARHFAEVCNIAYHERRKNTGIRVMEEDWDTLIILDACRADMFERRCKFDGSFDTRKSRGSSTPEWLEENFVGQEFHDTVYITTNPFVSTKVPEETFHDVIWSIDMDWDYELGTVPPKPVCNRLREAREEYPHKRIIAHFIQPHHPFIGPIGQQFTQSRFTYGKDEEPTGNPWRDLKFGLRDITEREVWEGYIENLDLVFDALDPLMEKLEGKTVISADHGNIAGERMSPIPLRGYGHPVGLHVPELVEVPWFTIENGDRLEIRTEDPLRKGGKPDKEINNQLEALGYQ